MKIRFLAMVSAAVLLFTNSLTVSATTFKPEITVSTTTTTATTKPQLTLNDVIELSKKGDELTWSDFEKYEFEDIGSGLYINKYDIEDDYTLLVGGVPEESPYYILLYRNDDEENVIDIRTEDVEAFLNTVSIKTTAFKPETTVQSTTTTTTTTITTKLRLTLDDVIELSKKGNELTWSDFEKYKFEDIGSGLYINKYYLEDDYTLLVGGVPEKSPYYILLYRNDDEKNGIDIRTEDVEAFLYGDIQGDVNVDGVFSVADVILLQKWLLSTSNTKLANWKAADFCEDDKLDVFDLCLMKRELLYKSPALTDYIKDFDSLWSMPNQIMVSGNQVLIRIDLMVQVDGDIVSEDTMDWEITGNADVDYISGVFSDSTKGFPYYHVSSYCLITANSSGTVEVAATEKNNGKKVGEINLTFNVNENGEFDKI